MERGKLVVTVAGHAKTGKTRLIEAIRGMVVTSDEFSNLDIRFSEVQMRKGASHADTD